MVGSGDTAAVFSGRADMPKVSVPVGPTGAPVELERGNGATVDTEELSEGGLEMPVPPVGQATGSVALGLVEVEDAGRVYHVDDEPSGRR